MASDPRPGPGRRGAARAFPLVTMALAGGILFAATRPFLPLDGEVVVDARTVDRVLEDRADALARDLTATERREALRRHVDDEILLHEGYRRDLLRTNGTIRARLLRRMRLALSEGIPEASRAQLRAYFNTHSERYMRPASLTFGHVFFAGDTVPDDADSVLAYLARGRDFTTMGDRFWLGPVLDAVSREQLAAALGPSFAEAVFALPEREWRGPIRSSRGVHYVAVLGRRDPGLPRFEDVETRVRADWTLERRTDLMERRLERIRADYTVEVDDPGSAGPGGAP